MRQRTWRAVATALACGLAVGGAATGLSAGAPSVQQQSEPTFSCCERNIKVGKIEVIPEETEFKPGSITVRVIFLPTLHWHCERADRDCFAFYDVTVGRPNQWDVRRDGRFRPVDPAFTRESITTESPLKSRCDGKEHKGQWMFVYTATITTTEDEIRNQGLRIDLDIPANKGTSYRLHVDITDVDRRRGGTPTVKIDKKEKEKKPK